MTTRKQEIRELLSLSDEQFQERAGRRLVVLTDIDALHQKFAESVASEIQENNTKGQATKLILPVGPVGQYPILAGLINEREIDLKKCWFFMMDEHCDDDGVVLDSKHPLSFRRAFEEHFTSHVDTKKMLSNDQLVFPDHMNLSTLGARIAAVGGIDTTYGGIGIHGHIAYNEPEANVRESDARIVCLNDFTRTINAIRAEIGGNLEGHPRKGATLGMRQLLGANRIRLYCRNGIALDWANTVLRLAVLGKPGDDYPVTHIRDHQDYVVTTDQNTACQPNYIV